MPDVTPGSVYNSVMTSHYAKVLAIGFLILLLQIPIVKIREVIMERQRTRGGALEEVTSKWGKMQNIVGPTLVVPYIQRWVEIDKEGIEHPRSKIVWATFLPEALKATGQADCQVLHRGIYEIPVYRMSLEVSGIFERPNLEQWQIPTEDILWDRVHLSLGISDTRAITEKSILSWNDKELELLPSTGDFGPKCSGIHAKLKGHLTGDSFSFSFPLNLNGSQGIYFAPVGKETDVNLTSDWNAPSFQGTWLPTKRTLKEDGFEAAWKIPFLGRNYPQSWRSSSSYDSNLYGTLFGVNMISPVDHYRMSDRSIKYQLLFIVLTFAVFWLFEVLSGVRIHFIQYLLVGAGLCLFYLLEISLAEHIGFLAAYFLAAASIVLLIAFYSLAVLRTTKRAAVMGCVLVLLYMFLYVLLMIQDYALLIGSVALFVILGIMMYLTREIDWYSKSTPFVDQESGR